MPNLLRRLKLDSVDSVDKGAGGAHGGTRTRVLIMKRNENMEDILKMAQSGKVSEPTLFAAMSVLARQCYPAKSDAQAWVEFTEGNAIGKRLEAVRRSLPKASLDERFDFVKAMAKPHAHAEQPGDRADDDDDVDADKAIDELAEQHLAKNPKLKTHAAAVAHVIEHTEEGRAAYARSKVAHLRKNA
jgi:hypothetical protein